MKTTIWIFIIKKINEPCFFLIITVADFIYQMHVRFLKEKKSINLYSNKKNAIA